MLRRGLSRGPPEISQPGARRQRGHHAVLGRLRRDAAPRSGASRRRRCGVARQGRPVAVDRIQTYTWRAIARLGRHWQRGIHATGCGRPRSAVACEPIPACIDELAIYCGNARCTEAAASGTPEVGRNAVRALEGPRRRPGSPTTAWWPWGPAPTRCCASPPAERTAITGARALGGPCHLEDAVITGCPWLSARESASAALRGPHHATRRKTHRGIHAHQPGPPRAPPMAAPTPPIAPAFQVAEFVACC